MLFTINPQDGLPIFRQLARQVKHAVASGKLKEGDKLPSQRELASELVINHLTVKKAYDTLEAEKIIATLHGRGAFISSMPSNLHGQGSADLRQRANDLADNARLLGVNRVLVHRES